MDSCQICGKKVKENNYGSLSGHLQHQHKDIKSKEYFNKYLKIDGRPGDGKCVICGNPTKYENIRIGYKRTCGHKCGGILHDITLKKDEIKNKQYLEKLGKNSKKRWANYTEEQKQEIVDKISIAHKDYNSYLSDEEKIERGSNIANGLRKFYNGKTKEERQEILGWANLSKEEYDLKVKTLHENSVKKFWDSATDEEKEELYKKRREQIIIARGRTIDNYTEFEKYRKEAIYETRKTYRKFKKSINKLNLKRGRYDFHLDHKYSISEGFNNNVPIEVIASKYNLELIPSIDNLKKGQATSITLEELYSLYNAETTITEK